MGTVQSVTVQWLGPDCEGDTQCDTVLLCDCVTLLQCDTQHLVVLGLGVVWHHYQVRAVLQQCSYQVITQWVAGTRLGHQLCPDILTGSLALACYSCSSCSCSTLSTMAGEFWINLFGACVTEQEPQPRRPRIDRSQIGQPINFRHTGHVGSTDLGSISSLQMTMKGKGGGEQTNIQVPHIMNARSIHELKRTSLKA